MSFSRSMHRAGRIIGDVEAASKGPKRLATRMIRRALFVAALGAVGALTRKLRG